MMLSSSIFSFLLGIGIGAEYPCGSVSAAEQSEEENIHRLAQHRWVCLSTCKSTLHRAKVGKILFAHLCRQHDHLGKCIRCFCAPCIVLDVSPISPRPTGVPAQVTWFFNSDSFGNEHLRAIWRLSLGLGAVPAIAVFLWRLNMDEPTRYKKDSMNRVTIPYKLVLKRYWVSLSGISAIWCVVIIALKWWTTSSTPDIQSYKVLVRFYCVGNFDFELFTEFLYGFSPRYPVGASFQPIASSINLSARILSLTFTRRVSWISGWSTMTEPSTQFIFFS
jgi:hypothetical protein